MKNEGQPKQQPVAGEHYDDADLGDIGRHWQASRRIEAREPAPSHAPAPRTKAN